MKWRAKMVAMIGAGAVAGSANAATAHREPFGKLADGTPVKAVVLTGANGVSARIMTLGATLQALSAPDRSGHVADVTLGYDDARSYVEHPNYWGQTIGRYANRIAGGRFTLDGKAYQLTLNDKTNSLHGGTVGFGKRNWQIVDVSDKGGLAKVALRLVSPAGDQGYPGNLTVTATYTLDDRGSLTIDMDASTDAPTIVNLTNHALFNLAGEGAPGGALTHRLTIPAHRYTPVSAALIPTGELRAVAGTPFDLTAGRILDEVVRDGRDPQIIIGRGIDHNFVLDAGKTVEPTLAPPPRRRKAANDRDATAQAPLESLVRQSRQCRHDRALPGALHQLRNFAGGASVRQADHRHRSDRERSDALQSASSRPRPAC